MPKELVKNRHSQAPFRFPGSSVSIESACNAGDWGSIPGSGRSPEKEMATHFSTLAWKIWWTEEPGRLRPRGHKSQTQLSDWTTTNHHQSPRGHFPDRHTSRLGPGSLHGKLSLPIIPKPPPQGAPGPTSPRVLKFPGSEWDRMKESASWSSFVIDNVKGPTPELPALGNSHSNHHHENLHLIAGSVGGRAQPDTGETSLWETLEETWSSTFTFLGQAEPPASLVLSTAQAEGRAGPLCTASWWCGCDPQGIPGVTWACGLWRSCSLEAGLDPEHVLIHLWCLWIPRLSSLF